MKKLTKIIMLAILFSFLRGCSELTEVSKLIELGFYLYVLPDDKISELNWSEKIISFNDKYSHCEYQIEYRWDPIIIVYSDLKNKQQMIINIGPNNPFFDYTKAKPLQPINLEWLNEPILYYYYEGQYTLSLRDKNNVNIWISTTDINNIKHIQYLTPLGQVTTPNPWERTCNDWYIKCVEGIHLSCFVTDTYKRYSQTFPRQHTSHLIM